MTTLHALRGALAAASLLVLSAGCGRDDEGGDAPAGETAERGGTAIVAEAADINMPVSVLANTQLDGDLAADVLNMSLVHSAWKDDHLEYLTAEQTPMALARSYEYVGPDSTAIRFHMRSDARWSDGRPITAADVAYTFGIVGNPDLASPRQDYVANLDSVSVQNDSTLTMHFKRRSPLMLRDATLTPIPQHVFGGTEPGALRTHPAVLEPAGGKLVTSGPWVIGQWEKGQRVVLTPNPHFQPRPNLSQLVFRIIPDPTTRLVELQTGAVDMVKAVTSDQIPNLKAQPNLRVEKEPKRTFDFIAYNPARFAAFADPEIRRALGMAIDQRRVIQGLQLEEYAVPASGPYPPILSVYDEGSTPPVPYDTAQAKRILASKGWRDSDGDGVLDQNGRPFRFTLLTNAGSQRRADATQLVQQQWRQIGVDARLEQVEFNTFMTGRLLPKNYEAALAGWVAGLSPDFVKQLYGAGSPYNITGFSDPKFTVLVEQALAQPTEQAARPYWQRAAAEIVNDQPYTWLYYLDILDVLRNRLRGVKIDSYGPYQNTWEWWIPQSQQGAGAPATPQGDSAR